jgi:hypothetical protein
MTPRWAFGWGYELELAYAGAELGRWFTVAAATDRFR